MLTGICIRGSMLTWIIITVLCLLLTDTLVFIGLPGAGLVKMDLLRRR